MNDAVFGTLPSEQGHFLLESGYHASLWMDLEALFLEPRRMDPLLSELADRVSKYEPDVVCGPLVEGAFVALSVARAIGAAFIYTERLTLPAGGLYPFGYRLPVVLRPHVEGRRVVVVNDVISAGSAVRGSILELEARGATVVAVAALLVLGDWTRRFSAERDIGTEALLESDFELWEPETCPLCARGLPLERRIQ
jgi:orotate phosphoribosyltransferase